MRYWKKALKENLTYHEAEAYIRANKGVSFITRPEWDGFHFYGLDGKYRIFFRDGHFEILNKNDAMCQDATDWMIVDIKLQAFKVLKENTAGGLTPCL